MLELKKVAVTGGISCGKTTVTRFLQELGAYVVYSDKIVHRLLTPDNDVGKKVIDLLGPEIVVDNKIDRSRVASQVFHHPGKLRKLEKIIHPVVLDEINLEYEKASEKGSPVFVVEIPLLFEINWEHLFDYVITVIANDEVCWERFRKKTGYGREEFDSRMRRQLNPSMKAKKSNLIVENNSSIDELYNQVRKIYQESLTSK